MQMLQLERVTAVDPDAVKVAVPVVATGAGWIGRTWWTSRQASRAERTREAAIDRTAARVEKADQLDRLEAEVARKDERIAQLETRMSQLERDLIELTTEVARYRAGLIAPHSYVLIPRGVVDAIRRTHPGALPAVYPGEELPA